MPWWTAKSGGFDFPNITMTVVSGTESTYMPVYIRYTIYTHLKHPFNFLNEASINMSRKDSWKFRGRNDSSFGSVLREAEATTKFNNSQVLNFRLSKYVHVQENEKQSLICPIFRISIYNLINKHHIRWIANKSTSLPPKHHWPLQLPKYPSTHVLEVTWLSFIGNFKQIGFQHLATKVRYCHWNLELFPNIVFVHTSHLLKVFK